jgi:hypothetical protein
MMRPKNIEFTWHGAPLMKRLEVIAAHLVNGEQALEAVVKLLSLVALMASMLSAEARIAIAAQLKEEADALCPPVDRRIH